MIGQRGSNVDRYYLTDLLGELDWQIRGAWSSMHQFRRECEQARATWIAGNGPMEPFNSAHRLAGTTELRLRMLLRIRKAGRG